MNNEVDILVFIHLSTFLNYANQGFKVPYW
jgi:hypothetical protein